jgi:hypothetical protein
LYKNTKELCHSISSCSTETESYPLKSVKQTNTKNIIKDSRNHTITGVETTVIKVAGVWHCSNAWQVCQQILHGNYLLVSYLLSMGRQTAKSIYFITGFKMIFGIKKTKW